MGRLQGHGLFEHAYIFYVLVAISACLRDALIHTALHARRGDVGSQLHCSDNSLRFPDFWVWFVLGPGHLQEAPGSPGKAHGRLCGASRGPPEALGRVPR